MKKKAKKPARKTASHRSAKPQSEKTRTARKPGGNSPHGGSAAEEESIYETSSLNPRTRTSQNRDVPDNEDELDTESGDLEGLSRRQLADSESVEELVDEGQDLEGELVEAVEDAPDPDQAEVSVHKAPRKAAPRFRNRNRL